MYRIKNDKRQLESADLIMQGLSRCLERKRYEEISVTEIIKESGVGRATFYRLFDTPDDVLEYASEGIFESFSSDYKRSGVNDFSTLFHRFYDELGKPESKLLFPLSEGHRISIMTKVFMKHTDDLKRILTPGITLSEKELDYFVTFFIHASVAIFVHYDKEGRKESPEELLKIYERCLETMWVSMGNESFSGKRQL